MKTREVGFRMDFVMNDSLVDETTHTVWCHMSPDSRRYEWVDRKGERYLYDRKDDLFFPERVVEKMAQQIKGMQMSFQQRRIHDVTQYLQRRIPDIRAGLKGMSGKDQLTDPSGKLLEELDTNELGFAIMCIDIAGSTRLAETLGNSKYSSLVTTLLNELSQIVYGFCGHVLKYTGDGIIAYFPEPSLMTMNDLALNCASVMMLFVNKLFNSLSYKYGYPSIGVRIGLDTGKAVITTIGSSSTKRHKDIIGKTVSLTAKIQSIGSSGDILVGEAANRLLHTMWRLGLQQFPLPKDWPYKNEEGEPYCVFKLQRGFIPKPLHTIGHN